MKIYRIPIDPEQKNYAWSIAKAMDYSYRGDDSDGNREQKYTGILGEVIFADIMDYSRPRKKPEFDKGIDFTFIGVNIDIKTMARDNDWQPHYVNNLMKSQVEGENYETNIYVFCNINKRTNMFEIIGWVPKYNVKVGPYVQFAEKGEEIKRSKTSSFKARADMYEIRQEALSPFISPVVFIMESGRYAKI